MLTRFIDTAKLQAALAALLSLVSCQHQDDGGSASNDGAGDEPLGEMISCAVNGSSVFNDDCRLEREAGGLLVIHKPDGAFIRLRMKPGGAVDTADGFLTATSHAAQNGGTAVDVGDDHYIIPAPSADSLPANPPADGASDAATGAGDALSQ